jgi:hypothetical protein
MINAEAFLEEHGASPELREFARSTTLRELWQNCTRADWMLWMLNHAGAGSNKDLRVFACWCARRFYHLMRDQRSKSAVAMADLFASGHTSRSELHRSSTDAADAADQVENESPIAIWVAKLAWATTQESAIAAATKASLYAAMLARATATESPHSAWLEAMRRQSAKLRELVGNPFPDSDTN